MLLSQNDVCKIGDFGLSKALETMRTHTQSQVGTPAWTAPEVLRGEPYSSKTDVYSFGVIVWVSVNGRDVM